MDIRQKLYLLKTKALDILCASTAEWRHFEPEENIIISGYPRSGSTWVAELINQMPRTAILWEPLHLRSVPSAKKLELGWRPFVPEHTKWKEGEAFFTKIFRGELLNFWLSSRSFPLQFCNADRMIVKFVRANGIMPWLTRRFTFEKTPLYLLRHPFAIVASQMKEGSWDKSFQQYMIPDVPYDEIYQEHAPFLSSIETKPEAMIATWCINNKIMLDHERYNQSWIPLHYEHLLVQPEQELQKIFDEWNMSMPEGALAKVRKASSTTVESTFQEDIDKQLRKWQDFFSREEQERMQKVLDYFEIKIYAADSPLPQVSKT